MNKFLLKSGDMFLSLKYSFIYRLMIVLYSIVLYSVNDTTLSPYYLIIQIILYFVVYLFLLIRQKHFLRTLFDYIYIIATLINYDIFIYYNFIFLLFPFINIPNHTGKNRSPAIVFLLAIISFTLIELFQNNYIIEWQVLMVGFSAFFFFSYISNFDVKKQENLEYIFRIYQDIDDSIIKEPTRTQIPKIYRMLIKKLEEKLNIKIERILCFKKSENDFELINSSVFTLEYEFKNNDFLNEEKGEMWEHKIKIDGDEKNIILNIKINEYYFLIIQEDKNQNISFYHKLLLESFLHKIFEKLATVITFELGLYEERYRKLKNINKQQHYVLETMRSTHYLTNKLSSIKNYLTIQADLNNSRIKKEIKVKMQNIANDELKQANKAMRDIVIKTSALLNKKENPFIATSHENIKAKMIYMTVMKMLSHEFKNNEVHVTTELDFKIALDRKYSIDIGTLELILVDILANMKKYSKDYQAVFFKFSNNLTVDFINDFDPASTTHTHLAKIVKSHNEDDRREINRSRNFGLLHIKEQAKQNDISMYLELDKDFYKIQIIFEKGRK